MLAVSNSAPEELEWLPGGVGGNDPPTTCPIGVILIGGGRGIFSASARFPVNERRSKSDIFGKGNGVLLYDDMFSEVADEFAVTYSLVEVLGREGLYVLVPVEVLGRVGVVEEGLLFFTSFPRGRSVPPGDNRRSGLVRIEVMISSEVKYSCAETLFEADENSLVSMIIQLSRNHQKNQNLIANVIVTESM